VLASEFDAAAGRVRLTVADCGVGIDAEGWAKLFEPFYSTKGLKGTGLGLAVARKIAREHGGDVTFSPGEPKGSVFTMSLPISSDDIPVSNETHAPGARAAEEEDEIDFGI